MSKNAVMPLTDYENACNTIREKTATTDLIKSGELTEKINEVFEKGKQSEHDKFWDTLQEKGNRTSYQHTFARSWTDDIYNPKYPIVCGDSNVYTAEALFLGSKITDTKVPITISGTRVDTLFQDCAQLKTIRSLTLENIVRFASNAFRNCRALEELNVYGTIDVDGLNLSYSPLLTHASLLTVINALKDLSTLVNLNIQGALTGETNSIIGVGEITENKTYYTSFYTAEWGSEDLLVFDEAEAIAQKMDVNGVECVGIHYTIPFVAYQDTQTFHLIIYQDGENLKELRYIQDHKTEENFEYPLGGDTIVSIKTKQGDGTHTVTLGSTNLAKLTDAEKVQATEKGWTLL